jgi:hypothetical protein
MATRNQMGLEWMAIIDLVKRIYTLAGLHQQILAIDGGSNEKVFSS